jgi:hypothetical protein
MYHRVISIFVMTFFFYSLTSCSYTNLSRTVEADLADQYFKAAIALIELHKTRFGEYPKSISDIKYVGGLDVDALRHVDYKPRDTGYVLNLVGYDMVLDNLNYPEEFWQGLGLLESNVKRVK